MRGVGSAAEGRAMIFLAAALLAAQLQQVAGSVLGLDDKSPPPSPPRPPFPPGTDAGRFQPNDVFGGMNSYTSKPGDSLPVWLIVIMCSIAVGAQSIFLVTIYVLRKKKKKLKADAEAARAAAIAAAGVEEGADEKSVGSLKDAAVAAEEGEAGPENGEKGASSSFDDSCHGVQEVSRK